MTKRPLLNEQLSISKTNPIRARFYDYDHFTYPWHFHGEYEIIYINKGAGQRFVGDNVERFSAGEILLMGPNLPHYMRSDPAYWEGDDSLRVKGVIIQFETDFMSHSIANYPQLFHINALLEESRRGLIFPNPQSAILVRQINQMPLIEGLEQLTKLLTLLQEMAISKNKRMLSSPNFQDSLSSFSDIKIQTILSYLCSHYTAKISLDEIASLAAMNPTAFCRYFKGHTGKTFMQYILEMRVGYACKLIMTENLNISQISLECGFETIPHFNRMFKRLTGFTPTAYLAEVTK